MDYLAPILFFLVGMAIAIGIRYLLTARPWVRDRDRTAQQRSRVRPDSPRKTPRTRPARADRSKPKRSRRR